VRRSHQITTGLTGEPDAGQTDRQRRAGGKDDVRSLQLPADARREPGEIQEVQHALRAVHAGALVRVVVGGVDGDDLDAVRFKAGEALARPAVETVHIVTAGCQHRDSMAAAQEKLAELVRARAGRAGARAEVLMHVKDVHRCPKRLRCYGARIFRDSTD